MTDSNYNNKSHIFPALAVAAGDISQPELETMRGFFSNIVALPQDSLISPAVSHHPDMNFSIICGTLISHAEYYKSAEEEISSICRLGGFKLTLSHMERNPLYPYDIGFNALVLPHAGVVMGNKKYLAPELISAAEEHNMAVINVKQGYAACSCLVIPADESGAETVCTSDRGIASACESHGIDTVLLPPTTECGISLPGYSCGFIGGCGGCSVKTGQAFLYGSPKYHPQLSPLWDTLSRRNYTIVSLSDTPLTDRGGIKIIEL